MNVAFHELAGIAIAHETAARLSPDAAPDNRAWAIACGLAVLAHGILDGLPHYYPLRPWLDATLSIALMATWLVISPRWLRWRLLLVCVASLLPDLVDHLPDDLRRNFGVPVPAVPNVFPWHWPPQESSWPGQTGPRWIESWSYHGAVIAFCVTAIVRTRHVLRRGR